MIVYSLDYLSDGSHCDGVIDGVTCKTRRETWSRRHTDTMQCYVLFYAILKVVSFCSHIFTISSSREFYSFQPDRGVSSIQCAQHTHLQLSEPRVRNSPAGFINWRNWSSHSNNHLMPSGFQRPMKPSKEWNAFEISWLDIFPLSSNYERNHGVWKTSKISNVPSTWKVRFNVATTRNYMDNFCTSWNYSNCGTCCFFFVVARIAQRYMERVWARSQ